MGDRNVTVTLKAGEGFNAPWVVIGGDTLQEINHQLDTILAAGTLQKAAQVAIAFHNGYRALRHEDGSQQPPQAPQAVQEAPAQPQMGFSGQAPPYDPATDPWANQQGQQAPAADPWANAPHNPAVQQAQQQAQPQQGYAYGQGVGQAAPQQQGNPGGRAPVCQCGQVCELKTTGSGRQAWRCPSWRWNNGNPTPNHDQHWVGNN